MTYLSLGEAAKAAGVAKGTISKALKSGKLSYVEKTAAGYQIDPAELFRAFPRKRTEPLQNERLATLLETEEAALLRVRLEAAERRAETAEADRDAWREQAQRLALTDQRPATPVARRGLWSRMFRRSEEG